MPDYSIVILICSTALSHSDCQPDTALDVVRGPQVNNPVMCALDAQTMLARTDLAQAGRAQYVKVVCTRSKNADQWKAEIESRKAAKNANSRPSLVDDRTRFTFFPGSGPMADIASHDFKNRSHTIAAYVDKPGDGVLLAAGGALGGYSLFVKDGIPTYEYNWLGQNHYRITSSEPLPTGRSWIRVEFKYGGGSSANGGNVAMFLDDKKVGEGRVEMTMSARFSSEETFEIGLDTGSPVSDQAISTPRRSGLRARSTGLRSRQARKSSQSRVEAEVGRGRLSHAARRRMFRAVAASRLPPGRSFPARIEGVGELASVLAPAGGWASRITGVTASAWASAPALLA